MEISDSDYFLDITEDVCPMTFVKVRLQIEKMSASETLEVRLKGEEPLENVPESVTELGHTVLSIQPEAGPGYSAASLNEDIPSIHRVVIRKR